MCQTENISHSIIRLSKRSFAQRLDIGVSPVSIHKQNQTIINNDLDKAYEILYDAYPSATKDDYNQFSYQLGLLVETLKGLYASYRHKPFYSQIKDRCKRLRMNISAIEEINCDFKHFKVDIFQNPRCQSITSKTKKGFLTYILKMVPNSSLTFPIMTY